MKKTIGNFRNEDLYLTVSSYANNNRLYVGIDTEEESYADLTINLSDLILPGKNYIFVNGDMTKELREFLQKKEIISEPIETYQYNLGKYDMVQINLDKLKEYDPEGYKDVFKNKEIER